MIVIIIQPRSGRREPFLIFDTHNISSQYFLRPQVIDLLEHEISLKGEKEDSRRAMLQAGRMNLSMCLLKSGEWIDARDLCEKVISENSGVAKAFFRRGEAQIHLNDLEAAESDFKVILNFM